MDNSEQSTIVRGLLRWCVETIGVRDFLEGLALPIEASQALLRLTRALQCNVKVVRGGTSEGRERRLPLLRPPRPRHREVTAVGLVGADCVSGVSTILRQPGARRRRDPSSSLTADA